MRKFSLFLILCFSLFCVLFFVASAQSRSIKDSVLRFHVVANSDAVADQRVKLLIRDQVLAYAKTIFKNTNNRNDAIMIAKNQKTSIENIANKVLKENGFSYNATCEIQETRFPTKKYGAICLPAGTYLAMNIRLGKAAGENWWCVLYPPLCFTNADHVMQENEATLKHVLSEKDYTLVTEGQNGALPIRFRFKIMELFSK